MLDLDVYIDNVLRNGRKSNEEPFSLAELTAIQESMKASRDRVNLPTKVRVLLGIVDVSNELEVGEVIVKNGRITGDVLVFRSPCEAFHLKILHARLPLNFILFLSRFIPR